MSGSSGPDALDLSNRFEDLPPRRRVFTNRNLRLGSIAAIGFDMDHTLAVYNTVNFDHLCFDLAIDRLIEAKGYPETIREVTWDPDAALRGLVVDKKLGNLIKIDAYNHVTRARHGFHFLDKDSRRKRYPRGRIRLGSPRYRVFDTLFDLPEGSLYTSLVDLKKQEPRTLTVDFRQLYDDIRDTVDTLHADGSLKERITADIGSYFIKDPDLVPTLRKYRGAGKRLFLLTNSDTEYTGAVMDHLVGGEAGSWESLFDLVVCSAGKPGYFLERGEGEPVPKNSDPRLPNRDGNCFIGGDSFFLEKKIAAGADEILYFGDHTYGDILRSKKSVGWRTAMIVPGVEFEVARMRPLRDDWRRLTTLEDRLEDLVMERDHLAATGQAGNGRDRDLEKLIGDALGQRARLQRKFRAVLNPHWESHFREGRAASRLGRQITEFACIYTSRVSNFLNYPTDKFFARPVEILPHERWALPEA